MLGRLFKARQKAAGNPAALYGAIVAQARSPVFYADMGVADTVDGRFEMMVLHTQLVVRRLLAASPETAPAGQEVFDLFCADMDRSLRELGVGDMAVPKRMKKMAEAYYGRAAAYEDALTRRDPKALVGALRRNIYPDGDERGDADRLATYVLAVADALALRPPAEIAEGVPGFPDPARFGGR